MHSIQQSEKARSRWFYSIGGGAIALLMASGAAMASSPTGASVPQQASTVPPNAIAQAMTLIFVHPTLGNDSSGVGSQSAPFRTISQALRVAQPNTTILLAAGTYSSETGETFPIVMRSGVTIQGDPGTRGQGVIIRGGGVYGSRTSANQNVAILGANQAGLVGVTVTNSNPRGYGLWVESTSPTVQNNTFTGSTHDGISIVGNAAAIVQGNYFTRNGASGISIFGTAQPDVRENIFENTGYGINIAESAQPRLLNNQVRQNRSGVVIQERARPILRGNTIENNQQDGLVAIAQSQPDLGTAADPGNNIFRSNGRSDVNTSAAFLPVTGVGNQATNFINNTRVPAAATQPAAIAPPARPSAIPAAPPARPAATSGSAFAELPQVQAAQPIPVSPPAAAAPQYSAVRPTTPNAVGWQVQTQPAPVATPAVPVSVPIVPAASVSAPSPIAPIARSSPAPTTPAPLREITVERQAAPAAPARSPAARPATPAAPSAPVQQAARPAPNANLLPVPSATIPMGHLGDLPTVNVSRNPLDRPATAPAAASGDRALAMGLRYRVVVEASSDRDQAALRSIVPGAFRVSMNGRTVMQTGAYSDRANADEAAQQLSNQGFRASVQAIE
ncbi:DUF1565 domain-containing protein [Microcoleus sp. FACHB-1515]|uniref:DUF1565 domain-containing protein n=1 Tax=Cyanophyceae TaxID=3028117 RepID=UPI0016865160|nr:DUF1565 domain-containing protein [Microcoleus sp. FACHB-1515]MBD2089130.1 DUF1565 domain-containing protein [Microcoleus sp. FACHB-1515]